MSLIQRFLTSFRESDPVTEPPGLIQKSDGTVWIVNPDGTESRVGNGGSQPVTEAANYSGVNVTITSSGGALDWQILDSGDDLLDVTNPLLPVVRKDGLFIVSAQIAPAVDITADTPLSADLIFDYTGTGAIISNTVAAAAGNANRPTVFVGGQYKLTAGQAMQLFVNTNGSEPNRLISLKNAFIARIGPA